MAEENIEIVLRAFAAAFRKPRPDYETVNLVSHPDHEFVSVFLRFEGGDAEGVGGFRKWLTTMDEAWARWDCKVEQVRSIDADRVLIDILFSALSKGAGVPIEQSVTSIVTVREGKLVRTEVYHARVEALEAAGLSE